MRQHKRDGIAIGDRNSHAGVQSIGGSNRQIPHSICERINHSAYVAAFYLSTKCPCCSKLTVTLHIRTDIHYTKHPLALHNRRYAQLHCSDYQYLQTTQYCIQMLSNLPPTVVIGSASKCLWTMPCRVWKWTRDGKERTAST